MPPHARPPLDRFIEKIRIEPYTGCWLWQAFVNPSTGYGLFRMPGTIGAHRAAWLLLRGPIPDDFHIDHRCRVKTCVNPEHLEPVTPRMNTDRGSKSRRMYCVGAGHPMTPDNTGNRTDGQRYCKTCHREKARAKRAAQRTA